MIQYQIKQAKSLQNKKNPQKKLKNEIISCQRCGQGLFQFIQKKCPICNKVVDSSNSLVSTDKKLKLTVKEKGRSRIEEGFQGIKEVSYT